MKDTENIIQKFRQKFKHSQFINYSTIELWLEEQIPLIQAEAVREVLKKIDPFDLVEDCHPDCTPAEHAYHEGTWSAHLKLDKILNELQPKTQDSEAGGDVDCFCHCHQNYHAFSANEIDVCDTPQRRCRHCEAGGGE